MSELVGSGRVAIVNALVDRVDALCAGRDVSRVVVLEAEAGAGKSRLVRELYERLRQRESTDGAANYWPGLDDRATGAVAGGDPFPSRKVVGPKIDGFLWPANVVPAFVWWDISCETFGTGEAVAVTDRFESWWAAHGTAMWWAWNTRAGNLEQLAQSRDSVIESARSALQESAVEGMGELIQMTGLPTLGLGWALSTSGRVLTAVQTRRDRKQDLIGELVHEADTNSKGQEIATALTRLARRDLSVVVAIEDAHRMGPDLAALLDALAAANSTHPVLVVATAWPEGRTNHVWNDWLIRHQARGTAEVQGLDPLEDSDLETLFHAHAPTTDPSTTAAVVQRWRNPFALELLMTWGVIEANVRANNGALVMSEEDLTDLPEGVVDLLGNRWGSLPKNVRRALALARAGLGVQALGTEPFIRDIISAAGARLVDESDAVSLPLSLQSAAEMRWLRTLDITDALADVLVADVIRDRLNNVIGRSGVAGMRAAVITELCTQINTIRGADNLLDDNDENRIVASWLISLVDAEANTDPADPGALTAAYILNADTFAETYNYTEAIHQTRTALDLGTLNPDRPDALNIRYKLALWMGQWVRTGRRLSLC